MYTGTGEVLRGASVLARKGDVYFANIPNLWLLRDTNSDITTDTTIAATARNTTLTSSRPSTTRALVFDPEKSDTMLS